MLRVDLGALDSGPLELAGVLPADDGSLTDLAVTLRAPVRVTGRLTNAGEGRYYWRGGLTAVAETTCRRCLAPVRLDVEAVVDVVFTEDHDAEDPSEYVIPEGSVFVDLREAVREELMLALPDYVLCRDDCRGLCASCGADHNRAPCDCQPAPDPRWATLDALRTKPDE